MRRVSEWVSSTGKRKLRLYERSDGLFWFDEIFEDFDDYTGTYWAPGYQSGLFGTADEAEAEIRAVTPWLAES
jgi:hypothetical protein